MKLLFDESLSPRLVALLQDLFPESESALRNGLAGAGDRGDPPKRKPRQAAAPRTSRPCAITVPLNNPLKTGTLHGILTEVALMRSTTVDAIVERL